MMQLFAAMAIRRQFEDVSINLVAAIAPEVFGVTRRQSYISLLAEQVPEAHGEEVAQMAMVGLEVEAGEFHAFGEPPDAGVEFLYFQAASFLRTELEMGG